MVQADFKGLDAGVHTGSIPFRFSDGSTQSISVTAIVSDGGSEGASPNSKATAPREADNCLAPPLRVTLVNRAATFPAVVNEALPLTVRIDDNCGRPVSSGKNGVTGVTAWIGRFSNGDAGAAMEAVPGGQFSKSFVFEKMPAGPATATGEIGALARLSDNQYVGGTLPVSVQLRTAAVAPPRVSTSVNSASFLENTPLAPGGFVTLFGERMTGGERRGAEGSTYPTTLANTRVLLGEKALPLQYVSADQINAQIPFDVEPNAQLALRIQRDDMSSVPTSFIVAKAQPAVFTSAQNGQGQAAAVNQSGTVNGAGAPAPRGSFISLYCTGLGAVSPASPAGEMASSTVLSRTVSPVTATLGGRSASVQFAGLAPGFTGLYQVNLQIPDETEAGEAEVVISVDGQSSPPVTVAVQ